MDYTPVKFGTSPSGRQFTVLTVPHRLDLGSDYIATMRFIHDFRVHAVQRHERSVSLDFRKLTHIGPRAALLLAAEIDRWCRLLMFQPVLQPRRRWNTDVRRLLREMGLYDLVKVINPPSDCGGHDGSLRFVRFRSEDQALGERADEIAASIEAISGGLQDGGKERQALYRGLVEAMTNVNHHAYPDDTEITPQPLRGRWWMSASFDHTSRKVTISFFDQGVGIPATTERKHPGEKILGLIAKFGLQNDDASLIQAATHLGRSRTDQGHRGGGLADIKRFTELVTDGRLTILSGRGCYVYSATGSEQRETLPTPIGGTLIHWEAVI